MAETYNNPYAIRLYYGYEETASDGVFHAFIAGDTKGKSGNMGKALKDMLEPSEDSCFDWDSMHIALPDSVVNRIKKDAIREYLAATK